MIGYCVASSIDVRGDDRCLAGECRAGAADNYNVAALNGEAAIEWPFPAAGEWVVPILEAADLYLQSCPASIPQVVDQTAEVHFHVGQPVGLIVGVQVSLGASFVAL